MIRNSLLNGKVPKLAYCFSIDQFQVQSDSHDCPIYTSFYRIPISCPVSSYPSTHATTSTRNSCQQFQDRKLHPGKIPPLGIPQRPNF